MNSVSSWFSNISKQITDLTTIPPEDEEVKKEKEEEKESKAQHSEEEVEKKKKEEGGVKSSLSQSLSLGEIKAEEVLASTKELGTALLAWTKEAGSRVTAAASQLEETSILGEFGAEQRRFVESKERAELGKVGDGPPWAGLPDESGLRKRILALSLDSRNFLRDPPGQGAEATEEAVTTYAAVAAATLAEDPNLGKMRFRLVPKSLSEARFWRNYFYRVELVKASAEMESLALEEEAKATAASHSPGTSRSASEKSWNPNETSETAEKEEEQEAETPKEPTSKPIHHDDAAADAPESESLGQREAEEFVSDGLGREVSEEELAKVRAELGIVAEKSGEDWEAEVLADLDDFELVDEGTNGNGKSDADWEKEISDLLLAEDVQEEVNKK